MTTIGRFERSAHESARSPRSGNCRRPRVARRHPDARRRRRARRSCASIRPTSPDVDSKAALLAALAKGLKLPQHFGNNWDALADSVEDGDWLGKHGCVIALSNSAAYRKAHGIDWTTFEDILAEAVRLLARAAQAVLGVRQLESLSRAACAAVTRSPSRRWSLVHTPRPARAADRARRCSRLLAIGHRQPGARRDAASRPRTASSSRKPASTPRRTAALVDWQAVERLRDLSALAPSLRAGHDAQHRARVRAARCRSPSP